MAKENNAQETTIIKAAPKKADGQKDEQPRGTVKAASMAQVRTLAQNVLADDPHLTKPQNLPIRNYFMTKHKVSDFSMIS